MQFGLQSLRAGGASTAANAAVPDRLFKRHDHGKLKSAKDGYVQDSVASCMVVSKSLDLQPILCDSNVNETLWHVQQAFIQ